MIIGSLIAGAIGDGAGSLYEGRKPPVAVDLSHNWLLSDDTQLTLATCESIVAAGCVDPAAIAAGFARAFQARTLSGLGASTYQALESLAAGGHWALVGRKGDQAAGNGAAMRAAPLAFCLDLNEYRNRQVFRDVCRITHHNDEAYSGALAVARAVQAAWNESWMGGSGLITHVAGQLPDSRVRDQLFLMESLDPSTPLPQVATTFGNSAYAAESVPLSLFAAQQVHGSNFSEWLRSVIEVGGDTDTIASMAGQIAGCALGVSQIPGDLIAKVPGFDLLRTRMGTFAAHVLASESAD